MYQSLSFALQALAVVSLASALPSPAIPYSPTDQGTTLRPIAIRDFEAATGLQRREQTEDFSDLSLQTQLQLIYGSPGVNGQLLLANMTLYAHDGLEMIMMERFEGLTSAVDCHGDDGTMSLTFSSADAYKAALQEWAHINDSDDGKFLLIANHDGCGPNDRRQPYIITKVTEDEPNYTTYLTAQTAPFSDVASTYDLDFGHITPYQQTSRIKERGLFGAVSCVVTGSCDESRSVTFDVSAGTKGKVSNIYSDKRLTLDCINCFTTGSFKLAGHISTHHWSIVALTLTAIPQDFMAELELQATVSASLSPASLQYEKQLLSVPIPGAGISVADIFSIGAILSYNVGVRTTIQGNATVDFGLSASIPNSAQLTADVKNPDLSSATGFGGGSLTPKFDVKDISASISLAAYSKPKLSFGVSLVKIGTADVDISVKLPEVDVTLTAAYNPAGVCTGSNSVTGVTVASSYGIEVDLDIDAKLGTLTSPTWTKKLFNITEPIASQCFPINIPGLQPSKTAIPTPVLVAPIVSVTSAPTHIYVPSGAPTLAPIVNGSSYLIAPSGASVPYSATARTGTPSFTGTNYIPSGIVVSGVLGSGTGTVLSSQTSIAPFPISNSTSSSLPGTTGTGFASVPSGSSQPSGLLRYRKS